MTRTTTGILVGALLGVTLVLGPRSLPSRPPSQYNPGRFGVVRVQLRGDADLWSPPERRTVAEVLDRMTALGFAWEWVPGDDWHFVGSSRDDTGHLRNLVIERVGFCHRASPGAFYESARRILHLAPQCVPEAHRHHVIGHGIGHALGMYDICPGATGIRCSEVGRGPALMNPSFATDGFGAAHDDTRAPLPSVPTMLDLAEFVRVREAAAE